MEFWCNILDPIIKHLKKIEYVKVEDISVLE